MKNTILARARKSLISSARKLFGNRFVSVARNLVNRCPQTSNRAPGVRQAKNFSLPMKPRVINMFDREAPKNCHVVLLGDSIFDNSTYVDRGHSVIEQLSGLLGPEGRATLLARDGDVSSDVPKQVQGIPKDATHLVLSVGGNDALGALPEMSREVSNIKAAMAFMANIRNAFQGDYHATVKAITKRKLPLAICTIYEDVPGLTDDLKTALSIFNDIITREALLMDVDIIDLRQLCTEVSDYSKVSPIEPSEQGGQKISKAIHCWLNWRSSEDIFIDVMKQHEILLPSSKVFPG